MGKIQRIEKGARPSGVPQGAVPGTETGVVSLPEALGSLAETGYKIAAAEEHEEALRAREAREAKQAITNVINVNRLAGDYEEALASRIKQAEKDFWETPEKMPEHILEWGRREIDRYVQAAPNTDIGIGVAQKTASILSTAMHRVRNLSDARHTQQTKNNLSVSVRQAVRMAEYEDALPALNGAIVKADKEIYPLLQMAFDPKEASEMRDKMKRDMTLAWANRKMIYEPLAFLGALDAPWGPIVDNLDLDERKALRPAAISAWKGLWDTKDLDTIREGISSNHKLTDAFMAVDPEFAGIAFDQKRAVIEQKEAISANLKFDNAVLRKLGIDINADQSAAAINETLDDRLEFIKALEKAHRRRTPYFASSDPAKGAALLFQMEKALKARNGKDLRLINKAQRALAVGLAAEEISGAHAGSILKVMALAMERADANAMDPVGLNFRIFQDSYDVGHLELNNQFEEQGAQLSLEQRYQIRMKYVDLFNQEETITKEVSKDRAAELANRAMALILGWRVPGGGR